MFNLEGAYGSAFVFAEVSKEMPSGEFVHILFQDKWNRDKQSAQLAKQLEGGKSRREGS